MTTILNGVFLRYAVTVTTDRSNDKYWCSIVCRHIQLLHNMFPGSLLNLISTIFVAVFEPF